jgi:two-component system LytT family sensor kinase
MGDPSGGLVRWCWRVWRWSFPLGAVFALLSAARDYGVAIKVGTPLPLRYWVVGHSAAFAFWSFVAPLILWWMWKFPLRRRTWLQSGAAHLVFYFALACLYTVYYWVVDSWQMPQNAKPLSAEFLETLYIAFSGSLIRYYGPILVGGYVAMYYARLREQELRSATLAAELAQAQLRALKMQLQPHFLFNTLHSISTLVHTNADGADRMIAQLSDLLRAALNADAVEFVPLRQELDFAEKYLAIEQTRFSDRLMVRFDVAPETLEAPVPYLILQPIVENAVRHGISRNVGAGEIVVAARVSEGRLIIRVTDNGPGISEAEGRTREGVGLKNTRARLEQVYAERFELRLSPAGKHGTVAEMILPLTVGNQIEAGEARLFSVAQIPPHISQGA